MIPGWAKNAFSPSNVALEFYSLKESVPNNRLVLVVNHQSITNNFSRVYHLQLISNDICSDGSDIGNPLIRSMAVIQKWVS